MTTVTEPAACAHDAPAATKVPRAKRLAHGLAFDRVGAVYVWLGIIVLFSMWVPDTSGYRNIRASIWAFAKVGRHSGRSAARIRRAVDRNMRGSMPRDREVAGRTSEVSTLALVSGFIRGFRRFSQITEAGAAREACGSDEEAGRRL